MAAQNNKQKLKFKKTILALFIILITIYLLFFFYNNYLKENKLDIYFSNNTAEYLQAEKRDIDNESDLYYQIFAELKAGPSLKKLNGTIPEASELLNYSLEDNQLILNFNNKFKDNHWGGSAGELMTVYSIVNSYCSLEQIESVKIIIEGKAIKTLAGHLDLSRALTYNYKLTK